MPEIHIDELLRLVRQRARTEAQSSSLNISLAGETGSSESLDPTLANRTITYEGSTVTVVLDFDNRGYLANIEFV
jgi:hypothetical protein